MSGREMDPAIGIVLVLAGVLGIIHLALGSLALVAGPPSTAATVLSLAQAVLGALLLPTVAGLAAGEPWGRWLGVVTLGGIAIVQLLPLLSGTTLAVPMLGIFLSGGAALYLLLAPGAFGSEDDTRPINEDTDPHRFMR